MDLTPTIFIILGALSATVSVITAVLTLRAEHKRLADQKRDLESRRPTKPPNAVTKSASTIQFQESDASILHHA